MKRFFLHLLICLFAYLLIFIPVSAQTATPQMPTSGTRFAACDLCGYCPPNSPPSSWEKCRQCLYPDGSTDSTAQDTLKVDSDTNQAVTPYPGRQYTFLGCISTNIGGFSQEGGVGSVTQKLLNIVFSLAGGVAFLYLLYGAFVLATSQADPERLNYGKLLVWGAIIGLIFCLTSVLIVNFIANQVLKIPGFNGS
jgi:hypothetical protein